MECNELNLMDYYLGLMRNGDSEKRLCDRLRTIKKKQIMCV